MLGRPVASRVVITWTLGGVTSLIHERSTYLRASGRPVNGLRPESTAM